MQLKYGSQAHWQQDLERSTSAYARFLDRQTLHKLQRHIQKLERAQAKLSSQSQTASSSSSSSSAGDLNGRYDYLQAQIRNIQVELNEYRHEVEDLQAQIERDSERAKEYRKWSAASSSSSSSSSSPEGRSFFSWLRSLFSSSFRKGKNSQPGPPVMVVDHEMENNISSTSLFGGVEDGESPASITQLTPPPPLPISILKNSPSRNTLIDTSTNNNTSPSNNSSNNTDCIQLSRFQGSVSFIEYKPEYPPCELLNDEHSSLERRKLQDDS